MDATNAELQLLTRHLSGVLTPQEDALFRDWLAGDPSRPRMLQALRDGWELSATLPPVPYDPDSAWARILARVQSPDARRADEAAASDGPAVRRSGVARKESRFARRAWRAAAVALLVAGSGLLWRSLDRAPATDRSAVLEIEVPRGQEAKLRLPDGSRVVLAPESKLRYPRSFGDRSRELHLEGMGYFEVVHDPGRPFIVHAGGGMTQVLGTRFVVRAYPDAKRVEVAVTQGKVAFRADSIPSRRAIHLTSGQVGRLDSRGVVERVPGSATRQYLDWMDGQPVIQNLPLSEALADIERWYDVELAVGDSQLASRRITTTMERSSLNETLAVIALALDARYVKQGDTLVFLQNH